MDLRIGAICGLTLLSCHGSASGGIPEARADESATSGARSAVVELFTSEGCSSCPPAEAVLRGISEGARKTGTNVFALEFHVDYWDEIGWRDRFSSPDCTARQRQYARAFGESGMYTPEMVVDGVDHFVGSDRTRATESVARSIARPDAVRLDLSVTRSGTEALAVSYELHGAPPPGAQIVATIIERAATVHIGAGENSGTIAHHTNVVRFFATYPAAPAAATRLLRVPPSLDPGNAAVVVFVQRSPDDRAGPEILGAAEASWR